MLTSSRQYSIADTFLFSRDHDENYLDSLRRHPRHSDVATIHGIELTCALGLADTMTASSFFCGTGIIILIIQHRYGLGRHFFYLDQHQKIYAFKYNFAGQPIGIMAAAFGRNASCIMTLQLFGTNSMRRMVLCSMYWQSLVVNFLTFYLFLFTVRISGPCGIHWAILRGVGVRVLKR